MKIGILTLPLYTNYGGILQAYALQTVLERLGHEVVEIEKKVVLKRSRLLTYKTPFLLIKRIVLRYLFGRKDVRVLAEKYYNDHVLPNLWRITQHTDAFIQEHLNKMLLDDYSDADKLDLDAIVVGSDQVWRPKYIKAELYNSYLEFTKDWDIKRLAYAVSYGTNKWEYTMEQSLKCSLLLSKFDAVSIRESSGVDFCKKYLHRKDAIQLIDPTLLLTKEDYIPLFSGKVSRSPGNMMVYVLDKNKEKDEFVEKIASKFNLNIFHTNSNVEDGKAPIEERFQPPLEPWLRGFYDAELIVTDSFHACVFSILFGKPFYVIANKDRGLARFQTLLEMLGLEDRVIEENMLSLPSNNNYIDYDVVYEKLAKYRSKANAFLKQNLL